LFEKPNDPPYFGSYHLLNASIIWPDEFWPVAEIEGKFKELYKATLYQWTKNFGFAKQYNCGKATGDRAAHKVGAFDLVSNALPNIARLNREQINHANKYGYVETIPDKTVDPKRGYPMMCTRTERGKVLETVPLSYHVQGTAGYCRQKAVIRCDQQLQEWNEKEQKKPGEGYYIVLTVHDELVFDFPVGGVRNLLRIKVIQKLMEESGNDIGIPLRVSTSYHPVSWGKEENVETYKPLAVASTGMSTRVQ
jgi:DNA polymerase I-like protein with 3'-5' exonuclease and polymerase domains